MLNANALAVHFIVRVLRTVGRRKIRGGQYGRGFVLLRENFSVVF